jgi:hypothetical protein
MSRWFRHYAGMMRDDKLVRVAIRSKQTIERVVPGSGAQFSKALRRLMKMDDTIWTPPKSPTFFARINLTWTLFWVRCPMPAAWLTLVWSSGATVSFNLTDPTRASLRIVSASGAKELEVTVSKQRVTPM